MLTNKSRKDEIEIWKHGWKFNYLMGQLNFISKKHRIHLNAYIENKYYFNELRKQNNKYVCLQNQKVNFKLLAKLLKTSPVIVYLDCYLLQKVLHAPHFVLATKSAGKEIEIADPFDGKIKKIPVTLLSKAINSLRVHLRYSPVLVTIQK